MHGHFEKGHRINNGRKQSLESIVKRLATLKEIDPEGMRYEKAKRTRAQNLASGLVIPKQGWNRGGRLTHEWAAKIGKSNAERHPTNRMHFEICKMYLEDNMTAKQIADRLKTTHYIILKRLREEGVKIKGLGGFRKGFPVSADTRKKLSDKRKLNFKSAEFCKKYYEAMQISPNKPEKKMLALLESLYPGEWKFTGDFSFTINGKCPDFVNCNGQKKIIELFGDYWHRDQNPQDRIDVFKPFGYETLVIWESEMKKIENVKNKIREFHEAK